jgi:hypothetical protein
MIQAIRRKVNTPSKDGRETTALQHSVGFPQRSREELHVSVRNSTMLESVESKDVVIFERWECVCSSI